MEFHEKLQELRKSKGLTQEELSELLYVSRSAISKWESGKGYPSIDSLKQISQFFNISIDDLLTGDKILTIAKNENINNIKSLCYLLFSMTDIFTILLIVLPLYPNTVNDFIYSVNLLSYVEISPINKIIYWIVYGSLILCGVLNIIIYSYHNKKYSDDMMKISLVMSSIIIIYLALTKEVYAIILIFMLFMIKCVLFVKYIKQY